jgi:hypothetical protein
MKKNLMVVMVFLLETTLFAQAQPKVRNKPESTSQPSNDLSALQTANNLAKYRYSTRSASALICAAEILI